MRASSGIGANAERLDAGWAALERGAWEEARACFEAAVEQDAGAAALEGLSWAAWWASDAPVTFATRERAYAQYRADGDPRGAARMATWLGTDHLDFRGELAVAQGWLGRARRLLDGLEPGPDHGWLWVHEAEKLLLAGDTAGARELGAQAAELGARIGLVDLEMMGLATDGVARVAEGDVDAGMSRLDEAAAAALGGELTESWAIGWSCCYLIRACEQARDYGRAAQWCRRLEEWSERADVEVVNRVCRAYYAGVLIWRGTWSEAERELHDCAERLAELRPPMAAEALVRLGELRRRQGRLDEAVAVFDQVAEHPLSVLGIGEVCLDRGDAEAARDRADEYLRGVPPQAGTLRVAGLDLLARAAAALGEHEEAAAAAQELESVAHRVASEPLRAAARHAAGAAAAAAGDLALARAAFEDATRLFHRSGAPFEAAHARVELARVLGAAGRARDAVRELRAAVASLRRIGADHAADRAGALEAGLREQAAGPPPPLTPRECEVLRLVAKGMSDRAIAEQLVISEHTVHRHVANILAKLGCSSRSAAVADALTNNVI